MNFFSQETLNKCQSSATIFSLVAMPFILAGIGYYVQLSITSSSVQKDYVEIAVNILSDNENKDIELRTWAVQVIDKNSPIPLNKTIRTQLLGGGTVLTRKGKSIIVRPIEKTPIPRDLLNK